MRLSDYVVQFIADAGVKHVFLVTGGGAMHLDDALAKHGGILPVCNSHEQASAIAAEAYGKATNNLGVAILTTGPGGTNAVTGVAGAYLDSTPCLFVSGQVKRVDRMFGQDGKPIGVRQLGVQEVDIVSIVRPITKYAVTVIDPLSIRYEMEKALRIARTGRPGPVWIDIPLDVQAAQIEPGELRPFEPEDERKAEALPREVQTVLELFNRSERPLLFVGNGVRLAHANREFQELVELLNVPVIATWCATDLVASDDPRFVGRPGTLAARGANFALQNCDFLLSIGARLDFAITGYAPERLARFANKVVVDIDPAELQKLSPHVEHPICADARGFLEELLRSASTIDCRPRSDWLAHCERWRTAYPVVTEEHRKPGAVSTYYFAEVLGHASSPNDLIVSGSSGSGIELFLLAFPSRQGQRVYHTAGLGAMGFALPASIGVCLAAGRSRTICVDGDGGFQFNIQELETVARLGLPIKFFVLNNNGYASIRASQKNYFGSASIGCDEQTGLSIPNIGRVAAAYGIKTAVIKNQVDLEDQVLKILAMEGPVVCDVTMIADETRAPRVASRQRADGSFVSTPLEDLWPFLPRDEFRSQMLVPLVDEETLGIASS